MQKVINSLVVNIVGSPKNRPIIFIHGFPFDSSMWSKQIKLLKKNYYCIFYDVRGLGESYVGDGQYTMEAFTDDLMSIVIELKLEKSILCGLSMGGYIALRAAEKYPEHFSALLLCDTRSSSDTDIGRLNRAAMINKINVDGVEKFLNDFIPNLFSDITRKKKKKLVNSVLNKSKLFNPTGIKGSLLAMLSRTDTTKYVIKTKLPILFIVGSFDELTTPQVMRSLHEKSKNSDFAIVPGAGHLSPLENPEFVNDVIEGFLSDHNL